jgi:hypothetical protein
MRRAVFVLAAALAAAAPAIADIAAMLTGKTLVL